MLPEEHGPCKGEFQRWRYEQMKGMCIPFLYGGCRGNRNNFATDTECLAQCSRIRGKHFLPQLNNINIIF